MQFACRVSSGRCTFVAVLWALGAILAVPPDAAEAVEYARAVSNRINTTGRPLSIAVPLTEGSRSLGEIVITILPGDKVMLPTSALLEKLGPLLGDEARVGLEQIAESDGRAALVDLRKAGFPIEFDPGQLELVFTPAIEQRAIGDLSLAGPRPAASAAVVRPAGVSGYLNMFGGIDRQWGRLPRQTDETSAHADFSAVLNVWNFVLENNASYDGTVDPNVCTLGWICSYQHGAGFKRRASRLILDLPEHEIRVQAGDTQPLGTNYQRSMEMLGLSIEKSPRKLNPGENIRPTGRSSFQIERPADVDIIVNGAIVQRLRLPPGNYNLRDIPFTVGANEIELLITDDAGQRRALRFTTFYDASMLAAGKSEWALAGGVPSYFLDGERQYVTSDYFATAFYRRGLSDWITVEADAQSDRRVTLFGAGVFARTALGVWGWQPSLSTAETGAGFASNVTWDLVGFRGLLANRESLQLAADFRSAQFRQPGDTIDLTGGIYTAAVAPYRLRLTANYTLPLPGDVVASLSGRYQVANADAYVSSPYVVQGDRYGCDLTLTKPLASWITASLTGGYSNERYLQTLSSNYRTTDPEFRAMLRLYVRPTERGTVTAAYDSLSRLSSLNAYDVRSSDIGRWETSVNVQQDGYRNTAIATGSVAYFGNRQEIRITHTGGFDGVGYGGLSPINTDERTSVRLGTAIAFAGGRIAIGQPIRNGGFAVVAAHDSIAGHQVVVGERGDIRAWTDALGPVIVPNLPAYTPTSIQVDVPDAPMGYSLGAGTIDFFPGYSSGYAIEVGSAYSVTVYGTLLLADGRPLASTTGVAVSADNPSKQVEVFTNSVGRFAADGLASGRWRLRMETDAGQEVYEIDVAERVVGLDKVGALRPAGSP